jgi:endonuclease/exonuclease/phosphatase family metal-dependent hydrolase
LEYADPEEIMRVAGLTFLFWNLKRARLDIVASLVKKEEVDVLMLAECPLKPADILTALNQERAAYFFVATGCGRIAVFTRFHEQYLPALAPPAEANNHAIRRLVLPDRDEILLCAVHFPSKLRQKPIDQATYAADSASKILAPAEDQVGHQRTILVGDLNMNPYEDGLTLYNCTF